MGEQFAVRIYLWRLPRDDACWDRAVAFTQSSNPEESVARATPQLLTEKGTQYIYRSVGVPVREKKYYEGQSIMPFNLK